MSKQNNNIDAGDTAIQNAGRLLTLRNYHKLKKQNVLDLERKIYRTMKKDWKEQQRDI